MNPSPIPNGYLGKLINNNRGQTLVEYGLLLLLIAVVVIASIVIVGKANYNRYSMIASEVPEVGNSSTP